MQSMNTSLPYMQRELLEEVFIDDSLEELIHESHGDLDVPNPPLLWSNAPWLICAQRGDHLHRALVIADFPWIWSSVWRGQTLYLQGYTSRVTPDL